MRGNYKVSSLLTNREKYAAANPKYHAGPDPLEREAKIKIIEPTDRQMIDQMTETLRKAANGPDATPQQKQAFAFWNMQVQAKGVKDSVKFQFLRRFYFWLLGKGTKEDHAKTMWGRGNAAVVNPEVAAYIDQFLDKRTEFAQKLQLLSMRAPDTLNGYYLYFKYIVNGKLRRVSKSDGSSFWDMSQEDYLEDFDIFQQVLEKRDPRDNSFKPDGDSPKYSDMYSNRQGASFGPNEPRRPNGGGNLDQAIMDKNMVAKAKASFQTIMDPMEEEDLDVPETVAERVFNFFRGAGPGGNPPPEGPAEAKVEVDALTGNWFEKAKGRVDELYQNAPSWKAADAWDAISQKVGGQKVAEAAKESATKAAEDMSKQKQHVEKLAAQLRNRTKTGAGKKDFDDLQRKINEDVRKAAADAAKVVDSATPARPKKEETGFFNKAFSTIQGLYAEFMPHVNNDTTRAAATDVSMKANVAQTVNGKPITAEQIVKKVQKHVEQIVADAMDVEKEGPPAVFHGVDRNGRVIEPSPRAPATKQKVEALIDTGIAKKAREGDAFDPETARLHSAAQKKKLFVAELDEANRRLMRPRPSSQAVPHLDLSKVNAKLLEFKKKQEQEAQLAEDELTEDVRDKRSRQGSENPSLERPSVFQTLPMEVDLSSSSKTSPIPSSAMQSSSSKTSPIPSSAMQSSSSKTSPIPSSAMGTSATSPVPSSAMQSDSSGKSTARSEKSEQATPPDSERQSASDHETVSDAERGKAPARKLTSETDSGNERAHKAPALPNLSSEVSDTEHQNEDETEIVPGTIGVDVLKNHKELKTLHAKYEKSVMQALTSNDNTNNKYTSEVGRAMHDDAIRMWEHLHYDDLLDAILLYGEDEKEGIRALLEAFRNHK